MIYDAGLIEDVRRQQLAACTFPRRAHPTDRITPRFLRRSRIIPLREEGEALVVAIADPEDEDVVAALRISLKRPIERWVAYPADIEAAFARLYGAAGQSGGEAAADVAIDQLDDDAERLRDMASEAPVIRLVSSIISGAVEQRASDIHIEAAEGRLNCADGGQLRAMLLCRTTSAH